MWLQQHAGLMSALASVGSLVVWTSYAWLFYEMFRRQRRTRLFIHQTGQRAASDVCLLVNLSSEPVHVLRSLAVRDGEMVQLQDTSGDENSTATQRAMQGPLEPGGAMALGTFADISRELDDKQQPEGDEHFVDVRVAVLHGFRAWPVGAQRRFRVNRRTSEAVPTKNVTDQLRSRRHKKAVQEWLDAL